MTNHLDNAVSAVYLFLAFLLVASRFASEAFHPPLVFIGIALMASLAVTARIAGRSGMIAGVGGILLFAAFLFAASFATRAFYDPGFDGYAYHLIAIWDIGAGWNPFFAPHPNIWVDSYPNGYWVLQSYIVSLTGILLAGQTLTIGLAAVLFLQAFSFYQQLGAGQRPGLAPRAGALPALIFAALLTGNPVVIGQFLTHYVDAPLYLFGTALLLFLLQDIFRGSRLAVLGAIACIILMVNTKTAALYYAPLIVMTAFLADLIYRRGDTAGGRRFFALSKRYAALYGAGFIISIVAVGYKPYVTNITDHGQLLYPSVDSIMKGNEPANMVPLSPPEKFFYGVFGRTAHSEWPIDAPLELKIPGTFELDEFKLLRFDTRRGGFGPFFGLAFLTAIAAYGAARLLVRIPAAAPSSPDGNRQLKLADSLAVASGGLMIAAMFFPESWWARYVPFAWAVPLLLVTAGLIPPLGPRRRIAVYVFAFLTLAALAGNVLAATAGAFREGRLLYNRTQQIEKLTAYPSIKLLMFYDPPAIQDQHSFTTQSALSVWTRLLADRGIATEITRELSQFDCDMADYLNGGVYWCIVIDDMRPLAP